MKFQYFFWLSAFIACSACNSNSTTAQKPTSIAASLDKEVIESQDVPLIASDTVLFLPFEKNPIKISIHFPTSGDFNGTIIALPGWNFPATQWCDSTVLCTLADSLGYVVILPEMGKSIYCETLYPETRNDWRRFPTRSWISETLLPHLQDSLALLLPTQSNYVMGLSTGARGAALLALDHPELFKACALLSGDYDQTKYPKDNLYKGYYGPQQQFPDRWKDHDNLITSIHLFNVPAYIGHGRLDKIVPIEHSLDLNNRLIALKKEVVLHVDEHAEHNYHYWSSEVRSVLHFFQKH